jgi:hypothetical protein
VFERRVAEEYAMFRAAVAAWTDLHEPRPGELEELERELTTRQRRLRALRKQLSLIAATSASHRIAA